MKKLLLFSAAAIVLATSCNDSAEQAKTAEEQTAAVQTGTEYTADAASSVIKWKATHKGGMAPRFGTLKITEGSISAENGNITGGSFTVDINSLVVDSTSVTEKDKKSADLEGHLKSPDFFDAGKYPTAKFTITSVVPYDAAAGTSSYEGATHTVSGNLTIKDSTVNVTFPAKIAVSPESLDIQSQFTVDRTAWGLKYGTEGNAADWMISKDFELTLDVKATAKK